MAMAAKLISSSRQVDKPFFRLDLADLPIRHSDALTVFHAAAALIVAACGGKRSGGLEYNIRRELERNTLTNTHLLREDGQQNVEGAALEDLELDVPREASSLVGAVIVRGDVLPATYDSDMHSLMSMLRASQMKSSPYTWPRVMMFPPLATIPRLAIMTRALAEGVGERGRRRRHRGSSTQKLTLAGEDLLARRVHAAFEPAADLGEKGRAAPAEVPDLHHPSFVDFKGHLALQLGRED